MTLGLPGKLIGCALSVAMTATGGVMLHNHLKPTTIGESLQKHEKLNLLEKSYEKWQELVDKHKNTENTPAKIVGLSFTQTSAESINDTNKKELQDKCESLWNTKISSINEENQKRIKQEIRDWCATNPKAIEKN